MKHEDTMLDAAGIGRTWRLFTTTRTAVPAKYSDTHCRACQEPLGAPSADNPISVIRLYKPPVDDDDRYAPGWKQRRAEFHLWHRRCFDERYTTAQTPRKPRDGMVECPHCGTRFLAKGHKPSD